LRRGQERGQEKLPIRGVVVGIAAGAALEEESRPTESDRPYDGGEERSSKRSRSF
jgi:hypothetical protein